MQPSLRKTCPTCRALVSADLAECPRCGTDINTVAPRTSSSGVTMFGCVSRPARKLVPLAKSKAGSTSKYESDAEKAAVHEEVGTDAAVSTSAAAISIQKEGHSPKKPWM